MANIYNKIFDNKRGLEKEALVTEKSEHISYQSLIQRIDEMDTILKVTELIHNQRILIFLNNSENFIIYLFAILKNGGIAVLADTKLNHELLPILKENNIKLIVTDTNGENKLTTLLNKDDFCFNGKIKNVELDSNEKSSHINVYQEVNTQKDDVAVLIYTSGSTNIPKGVEYTHDSISCALDNYLNTVPIDPSDILLGVTPFFHSYALGSCLFSSLSSGATLIPMEHFNPRKVLKAMDRFKITIFHGVPYMFMLLTRHYKSIYNLNSLRYCISAGSNLDDNISKRFKNLTGKAIHQEYGSTETNTISINLNIVPGNNSVGQPLSGVKVQLVKDEETNVDLIFISSKALARGYVNEPPFTGEWYNTGDMAEIDNEGHIFLKGRQKRLINISGLKLNPQEVEELLNAHPKIDDSLVKGIVDDDYGEIVEAQIVVNTNDYNMEEFRRYCLDKLAAYKVPRHFLVVKEINKSTLGKKLAGNTP